MRPIPEADSWRRMVLQSMPRVAWLAEEGSCRDVVLSSRCRILRNLVGHRFPNKADPDELREVSAKIIDANRKTERPLEPLRGVTVAERDFLVGCRLLSPDFSWQEAGRSLLLDKPRSLALMVNEEDHLRIQGVTAGWSVALAHQLASGHLQLLEHRLEFARTEWAGYLAASPFNAGLGQRLSSMFHLIGLAHAKRLPEVLRALGEKKLAVRGLFGESSRAVGAFVQVSIIHDGFSDFVGACDYLIREERLARAEIGRFEVKEKLEQALVFARSQHSMSLADGLRILGWARWAASDGSGPLESCAEADSVLSRLELRTDSDEKSAAENRAGFLRKALSL